MKENFEGQPEFRIEEARPDDAEAVQHVLYETWLATYPNEAEGITKEDIEDRLGKKYTPEGVERLRQSITTMPENDRLYVARDVNGVVVGLARGIRREDFNFVKQFYILPEYQGQGIGTKLWEAVHASLDSEKETRLTVMPYNTQAISFYEKFGFQDNGERFEIPEPLKSGKRMPQMTMVRPPDIFPFKPTMPL